MGDCTLGDGKEIQSMETFIQLISEREHWLLERILNYAKLHGYTEYTSPLEQTWRLSIEGINKALAAALSRNIPIGDVSLSISANEDPVAVFGMLTARSHRPRGVHPAMFLGLLKDYKLAYLELLAEEFTDERSTGKYRNVIERTFDRIEMAFCSEWSNIENDELIASLQRKNLDVNDEKNAYLTVFESLSSPIILIDDLGYIKNMNYHAAKLMDRSSIPGSGYYMTLRAESPTDQKRYDGFQITPQPRKRVDQAFPWLKETWRQVTSKRDLQRNTIECQFKRGGTTNFYEAKISRMLDVGKKYLGILLVLNDITERKQTEEKLRVLATTDPLTGINNRRHFFDLAQKEFQQARRYQRNLSVMVLDIDKFKQVNDSHGHSTGDDVLRAITAACASTLRSCDTLGRIGGEELAVVLPETTGKPAALAAERIRKTLAELLIPTDTGYLNITTSIGVACLRPSDETFDILLNRADKSLYEAKDRGRNCVVLESAKPSLSSVLSS